MTDRINDKAILDHVAGGHFYTDGANLGDAKTETFLRKMRQAEIEARLPSVEIIEQGPGVHVFDKRDFTEKEITDAICKEWGETPDTLTSSYMAVLNQGEEKAKMIVTQFFESVAPSPKGIEKVRYQFARKGDYPDGEFEETELIRCEFTEIDPYKHLGGNVMETVGPGPEPTPQNDKGETLKNDKKLKLEDNQFLDTATGMIVTWYKVPLE